MPLSIMKKVWKYCTYNKPFFLLVLILFNIITFFIYSYESPNIDMWIVILLMNVVITGYGMTITRDRINEGVRLPKIVVKDVLILGIKGVIVFSIYIAVQGYILNILCTPLDFPPFDLEELVLDFPKTLHLLFSHDPFDALIFVNLGAVLFYVTTFFTEIAMAKLADTGSFRSAFNILEIKRDIDVIGWRNYAREYTLIIVAIVLFTYLKFVVIPVDILDYIWNIMLSLFIFVTQYLGFGAIYSNIKKKKLDASLNNIQKEEIDYSQ